MEKTPSAPFDRKRQKFNRSSHETFFEECDGLSSLSAVVLQIKYPQMLSDLQWSRFLFIECLNLVCPLNFEDWNDIGNGRVPVSFLVPNWVTHSSLVRPLHFGDELRYATDMYQLLAVLFPFVVLDLVSPSRLRQPHVCIQPSFSCRERSMPEHI